MKVKKTVFGSRPEKLLYKTLESAWPDRVNLYPSLPFLSIIDWSGARLTAVERDYLKKASVDYTACDREQDRPLLSVEFDGLGQGYSHGGKYIEGLPSSDPYRREKMDLKLRLAREVGYPFFVVSYEEAKPITADDELTVAHAIVGRALASAHFEDLALERYEIEKPVLDSLSPADRREAIEDILVGAEVQLRHEWDPLTVMCSQVEMSAWETRLIEWMSPEDLFEPALPEGDAFADIELLKARIEGMENARRVGGRVTIKVKHSGSLVIREAWVRNVTGVYIPGIAVDLAKLLAFRAFLEYVRSHSNPAAC